MKSRLIFITTLLIAIITLQGCVYRVDIPQGNRINSDAISQLKIGMSSTQVEFLLGEPAIIDIYHPDDWYYIFFSKSGDGDKIDKRVMTLRFNNDQLVSIDGSLNL